MSRPITMRDAIAAVQSGEAAGTFTAEELAEITSKAELAAAIEMGVRTLIDQLLQEHPDIESGEVLQALLGAAAFVAIASLDMSPSDFAALAEQAAELSKPEAEAARRSAEKRGKA